ARLADLEEGDRRLLDVASCMGFEFDPKLLAPALGLNRIRLLKRLGHLEKQKSLIRSVGRKYVFDEHPIQEALYDGLDEGTRREYHAAIAQAREVAESAAEADPADLDGETRVEICTHFLRGGQPDRAERYVHTALDHLSAGFLNGPAAELASLALQAEGLYTDRGRLDILLRLAGHLDLLGWRGEEKETLTEALAISDAVQDLASMAKVRRLLGRHYTVVSRYDRASEVLFEAVELAQDAADRREEAAATGQLGLVYWRLGRYAEAREQHERALSLSEDAGDRLGEAVHRGNLGLVHFSLGQFEEAGRLLGAARELAGRRREGVYTEHVAHVACARGRYAEALDLYERALNLARGIGDRRGMGVGYLNLGLISRQLGRPGDARKLLEEARALFQQIGYEVAEAVAIHGIGLLVLDEGRTEEAESLIEEGLTRQREMDCRCGMAESLISLGRLRAEAGQNGVARQSLVEALGLGEEMRCPHTLVLAHCYLALHGGGDAQAAGGTLEELGERIRFDSRMEANVVLYRATGEAGYLDGAKDLLGHVLEHAPPEWRETMRKNVPIHREILEG
ncbi:MAG: tetratricopeptide repeat protein, partial [Planctomycetota bacterium]